MARISGTLADTPPMKRADTPRHAVRHPQFSSQRAYMTVSGLPAEDEAATSVTIAHMAAYAVEDSRSPIVRRIAAAIAAAAEGNTVRDLADAVFTWIQRNIRFQPDDQTASPVWTHPHNVEVLIRPVDLLTMPAPAGDCDDFSMLCAALLRSLGIETSFKAVAADPGQPNTYSHVYVLAHSPDGAIALDTSHGRAPGWEVPTKGKSRTWKVEGAMAQLGALPEWATELIKIGGQTGAQIAQARYGQPPQGTYIQQGNNVLYRQPDNAPALAFPGIGVGLGPTPTSGSLLLIVGLVAVLLMVGKR